MNLYRFDGRHSRRLAPFSIALGCGFWFLGNFNCSALAAERITGAQAVANLSHILDTPEQFAADLKESTQDFIKDRFGSMALAAAFGIAIRIASENDVGCINLVTLDRCSRCSRSHELY